MAGKSAAPGPAQPKVANSRRQRRKPEHGSETTVNSRKTEKDVDKLIHCLAEWTEDMRTDHAAQPQKHPCAESNPPPTREGLFLPCHWRGSIRGGILSPYRWNLGIGTARLLVGVTSRALQRLRGGDGGRAAVLPERHLRFDSVTESLFTSLVPAGSPFLAEARLQSLLDEAQSDPPLALTHSSPAPASLSLRYRRIKWPAGAVESGRDAIAGWTRRWQQTAGGREALRSHFRELLSGAANTMHGILEVLVNQRPARP